MNIHLLCRQQGYFKALTVIENFGKYSPAQIKKAWLYATQARKHGAVEKPLTIK